MWQSLRTFRLSGQLARLNWTLVATSILPKFARIVNVIPPGVQRSLSPGISNRGILGEEFVFGKNRGFTSMTQPGFGGDVSLAMRGDCYFFV